LQSYIASCLNSVQIDPRKLDVLHRCEMENPQESATPNQQHTRKLSLASALSVLSCTATLESSWASLTKRCTTVTTSMSLQSSRDGRCFAHVKDALGIADLD
jgi:hypothetical protein